MSDPFESYIEAQLQRHIGPVVGSAVPPLAGRFVAAAVGAGVSIAAGPSVLAALTSKTAVGIVVLTLAAGGGGAVAATVATGSPDPAVWTRDGLAVVGAPAAAQPAAGLGTAPAAGQAAPAVGGRTAAGTETPLSSRTQGGREKTVATAPMATASGAGDATGKDKGNGDGAGNGTGGRARHLQDDLFLPRHPVR